MSDSTGLLIFGAGGQARELIDLVRDLAEPLNILGLIDRNEDNVGKTINGVQVFRSVSEAPSVEHIVGVIGSGLIPLRDRMLEEMLAGGVAPVALVHPSAVVAPTVFLGAGAIVAAQSVVMNSACLGSNCLINVACSIGHDCTIGDAAVLSPGVRLGGAVEIGEAAFIGIGASVLPGLRVGERAVVGAGAVVNQDVAPGATVAGVPARPVG